MIKEINFSYDQMIRTLSNLEQRLDLEEKFAYDTRNSDKNNEKYNKELKEFNKIYAYYTSKISNKKTIDILDDISSQLKEEENNSDNVGNPNYILNRVLDQLVYWLYSKKIKVRQSADYGHDKVQEISDYISYLENNNPKINSSKEEKIKDIIDGLVLVLTKESNYFFITDEDKFNRVLDAYDCLSLINKHPQDIEIRFIVSTIHNMVKTEPRIFSPREIIIFLMTYPEPLDLIFDKIKKTKLDIMLEETISIERLKNVLNDLTTLVAYQVSLPWSPATAKQYLITAKDYKIINGTYESCISMIAEGFFTLLHGNIVLLQEIFKEQLWGLVGIYKITPSGSSEITPSSNYEIAPSVVNDLILKYYFDLKRKYMRWETLPIAKALELVCDNEAIFKNLFIFLNESPQTVLKLLNMLEEYYKGK
jgi:hypothetical protein